MEGKLKPTDRFRIFVITVVLLLFVAVPLSSSNAEMQSQTAYLSPDLIISAIDSNPYNPDIAYNLDRNEYLIVWNTELNANNINFAGARVNASGALRPGGAPWLTGEFTIAARLLADRQYPAVNGGSGGYLTAWEHDRGSGTNVDIYGRV